jgi:glycosidase
MNDLDAEDFSYEVSQMHQRHGRAASSMLNFLGSHDTARVLTILQGEIDRLLIAVAFLMTGVGIPLIYYGDEIGMCGGNDPDCRRTMVWDETRWNHRIQAFWRELIALRHTHRALRRGSFESLVAFGGLFAFRRAEEEDELIVVLNPGPAAFEVAIPTRSRVHSWHNLFDNSRIYARDGTITLKTVPSVSLALLQPETLAQQHRPLSP